MSSHVVIVQSETARPEKSITFARVEGLRLGLFFYCLTSLVVLVGLVAGAEFFEHRNPQDYDSPNLIKSFTKWDGEWYRRIVVEGYSYYPNHWSSVAFFPAYPLLSRLPVRLLNLDADIALLMVSHLSLAGAFVLLSAYVRQRYRRAPPEMTQYVLLALGLTPFTFFFRMAYSEATFLFVTILAMYGMERRWALLTIALIIGLATATRPVGVGLLAPLIVHIWHRSRSTLRFMGTSVCIVLIACWGLAGFMCYQYEQFGDPLAFVKSHNTWRVRPPVPWPDKLIALETLEPIWAAFDPSSLCFWMRSEHSHYFLFHQANFNRLSLLSGVILAVVGKYKRWLSSYELALVASFLFIPYVGRGYDMCMISMARFTSVAFPIYLVMGNLLWRMPAPLAAGLLGISSLLLGIYAGLFAASYPFF